MNIPSTYIEWIDAFNYIKTHPKNEIYIDYLNKGSLDANESLIEKLKIEMIDCILTRINNAYSSFVKYLNGGSVEYNGFSLKIVELRREFNYVMKLVNINIFTKEIKEELSNIIQTNADSIQTKLVQETTMIDRSGTINSMIKNNPINRFN